MDESSKESSGEGQPQQPEAAKPSNEKLGDEKRPSAAPADETSPSATPADQAPREIAASPDKPEAHDNGAASERTLPVVWSPKLGGDEVAEVGSEEIPRSAAADDDIHASGEAPDDEAAASAGAASAPMPRSLRFVLVAASFAAAAAVGSFIGSLSATGVERLWPAGGTNVASVRIAPAAKNEPADVATLKANLDAVTRGANGQLAKLAERLDRMERAQAEPAAKLARLAEAIDRLEKKNALVAASAAASAAASPETTGSIASTAPSASDNRSGDKVVPDWIVREAHGGRALIENRQGGLFDVTTGSVLPGLGRVDSVKRHDGQWVVVTAHGTIYSAP
jgi:hypothetical protein